MFSPIIAAGLFFILLGSRSSSLQAAWKTHQHGESLQDKTDVTIVVASQNVDNTTWLKNAFPNWRHMVYMTDDVQAELAVPANKGRESMAYLTYV